MKNTFLLIVSLFLTPCLSAQVNTDSIFDAAINDASAGIYGEALQKAETVLKANPDRYDVMVFIANIYAWKGDFSIASNYIEKAYTFNPSNNELYDSWLNILLWSKNYKKLIEVADLAIQNNYNDNYNIVLKKTLAFKALSEYEKGIGLIEKNKNFLDSIGLKQLYNEMQMLNKSNAVSLYYSIDIFDDNTIEPHHILYVDYSIKMKKHILIPRLNYANRYNNNDIQIEADYYHLFNNGHYLYTNYGAGINNVLFPKHRAGLEYYFPISKTVESSMGGRFLYSDSYSVVIVTGYLSKYFRNFWFSLRPFYVIHNIKNTLTTVVNARYYSNNPINYWGLELLYGNSPDERYSISQSTENLLLKNFRLKIEKSIAVLKYNELKLSTAYSYEEFITDNFRNKFTFEIRFKHKF